MLNKLFPKAITKYKIIEVQKPARLPELSTELKDSLKTLQYHPAFSYLMTRLRIKKATLNHALQEGLELTETQLRYLQAGIFWLGYLENEIALLTQTPRTSPRSSEPSEEELFKDLQASLELVGA